MELKQKIFTKDDEIKHKLIDSYNREDLWQEQ